MTKNRPILLIFTLLLSCTHLSQGPSSGSSDKQPILDHSMGKTRLLIHLIRPENLELILSPFGQSKEHRFVINTIMSQKEIAAGRWQLNGIVVDGKDYRFENPQQKVALHFFKNKVSYVGSYLFQCPKVSDSHRQELKEMSYFNRYKLNSSGHLCELVVGNNFEKIQKVWKKIGDKQLPLAVGF